VRIYFDSLTNPRLTCATPHQSVLSKNHIEFLTPFSVLVDGCPYPNSDPEDNQI